MFPDVIYSLKIDIFDLLLFAQSDREVPATSAGKPLLSPPYPPLPLPPPPSSTPPYPLQRPPYLTSSRTLPEQPNERASRAVPEQPHKGSWRTLPGKSFQRTWWGLLWTFRGGGASIEHFLPRKHLLCAVIIRQDCHNLWPSHNLCNDIHASHFLLSNREHLHLNSIPTQMVDHMTF